MSNDPPIPAETEPDEPAEGKTPGFGGIGLSGTVSLGAGGSGDDGANGLQRPPSMKTSDDPGLPKVTVPPFAKAAQDDADKESTDEPADEPAEPADSIDASSADGPEEDDETTLAPVSRNRIPPAQGGEAPADETTRPPSSTMRYTTPHELYVGFPEVKALTLHRPREGESATDYLARLSGSTTPEEAVTFTSFAAQPAMGIWWAYGCLRTMADTLSPEDRGLMEMVAQWSGNPDNANRWRVMKSALYAPKLTPVGYLGLAVGWSGGSVAPNDPAPVPPWRTPKAINTAVLSSIAHISLQERSRSLARFIDLAGKMFEV